MPFMSARQVTFWIITRAAVFLGGWMGRGVVIS